MPPRTPKPAVRDDAAASMPTELASPRLRVRQALVAAFALASFTLATPGGAQALPQTLAQVQPGEPAADRPLADPAQPVAVELAMRVENGAVVCRPDLARLPPNEELTLQLVNATEREAVFSAPTLFARGEEVASVLDAVHDRDAAAFVVPPGATAQIVFSTGAEGRHAFACAALGESAAAQGELVVGE